MTNEREFAEMLRMNAVQLNLLNEDRTAADEQKAILFYRMVRKYIAIVEGSGAESVELKQALKKLIY